jgi:bifunctional DNA-binding transcriptional regulator/antitoxin component of YhaV-PrlF toxin-antitoxin module
VLRAKAIEVTRQRWEQGLEAYITKILREGGSPAQVAYALSMGCGNIRILSRHSHTSFRVTVPCAMAERLGWRAGERLKLTDLPEGRLLLERATAKDLPSFARPVIRQADREREREEALRLVAKYFTVCARCGNLTPRTSNNQRYCPDCRRVVERERQRAYRRRRRQSQPSRQARPQLAEAGASTAGPLRAGARAGATA